MVCVPQPEQQKLGVNEEVNAAGDDAPAAQVAPIWEEEGGGEEEENPNISVSVFDVTSRSHHTCKSEIFIRRNKTVQDLFIQLENIYGHAIGSFEVTIQHMASSKDCAPIVLNKESPNTLLQELGIDLSPEAKIIMILQDVKTSRGRKSVVESPTAAAPAPPPSEVVTSVIQRVITEDEVATVRESPSPPPVRTPLEPFRPSHPTHVPPPPTSTTNVATSSAASDLDLFVAGSLIHKTEISYVGLVNQAMTCYLNSLLQALFMTPEFRNALYKWEFDVKDGDNGAKSIPFQLQKLFLNLQTSQKSAVETTELTKSFGWDSSEAWQQHDVQELCRVMFDALEHKFRNTDQADLINNLYEGKMIDYVKCLECGTEKQREDKFLDIPLPVRPFSSTIAYGSVEEALKAFVQPETLDGTNQYHCEKCDKKCDAHKGLKFTQFPYLLTLHLKRFDFDYNTLHRIKLNDKVVFPELLELNKFIDSAECNNVNSTNHTEESNAATKCDDSSTTDSGSALDEDTQLPEPAANSNCAAVPSCCLEDEGIDMLPFKALTCPWSAWDNGSLSMLENNEKNARRSLEKGPYSYELFAIMIHSGSASGGHYYAYIKDFSSGQWFCFNDQSVSRITNDDIRKTYGGGVSRAYYSGTYSSSTNAYMLMYRQIDKQRNCEAMKQEQFPPHIKQLLQNMRDQEEKEKSEKDIQLEVCRIKVYAHHPNTYQQILSCKLYCASDITLREATQRAHKQLNMEGLVSLENSRLVAYDQLQDSVEGTFEGRDDDPIGDIVCGPGRTKLDLLLEFKKDGEEWQPYKPGSVVAKVYVVDLASEEVEGPHLVRANLSQTIPEFREAIWNTLSEQFKSVKAQSVVVALERYGGQTRLLDDEARTLKSENFFPSNKVFVSMYMDDDHDKCFPNSKMHRLIDRFDNTITLLMNLPDTDQEILDELSIPPLGQQFAACPAVQRTSEDHEDVLSTSSCSLPEAITADLSALRTSSPPPPTRPYSLLNCSPLSRDNVMSWTAPEDEAAGGGASTGDQSASEDSSLTDSERTLVGYQERFFTQLPSPFSDESPLPHVASDTQTGTEADVPPPSDSYKSFKEDLDWDEDYEGGGNSSGAGHKRPLQATFFRATPYEENEAKMLKVELDKRTSLPALKKQLEPFVGVPMDYFKLFRSYSLSDEFEFSGYNVGYRDGESITIRLGRALRKGEFRGKVYQLCPGAAECTKFLFDWILAKGMLVGEAKKQILEELKKKHGIEIPFDRCRLRKKSWKNPGQVYYDNHRFEDNMSINTNWELFLQELPEALVPRPANAPLPELVIFVKRWRPSSLMLGPFQEIELSSTSGEELRTKLASISDIAPENIEIAKGQGSFPCDMSVLSVNSDLEWNPPTNSLNAWPLNIFEDGYIIFYRDSTEVHKVLTLEERKEIERTENSRVSRLGGCSGISTYSPRKERALKIYLDSTPPKSRIDCDLD